MSHRGAPHPLDLLTSALGGRRLYSVLWSLWLFLAICGHYAMMLPRKESGTVGAKIAVLVGISGVLVYSWMLLRGLGSEERRKDLLLVHPELPKASLALRILVWAIPILAIGAVLSPIFIR